MTKKVLLFLAVSLGLSLGVQVLFHPGLTSSVRLMYLICAIVLINMAVIVPVAYAAAMSQQTFTILNRKFRKLPKPEADRRWKSLLDVYAMTVLATAFLALAVLNALFFLQIYQPVYLIWVVLSAVILPLAIIIGYYYWINAQAEEK